MSSFDQRMRKSVDNAIKKAEAPLNEKIAALESTIEKMNDNFGQHQTNVLVACKTKLHIWADSLIGSAMGENYESDPKELDDTILNLCDAVVLNPQDGFNADTLVQNLLSYSEKEDSQQCVGEGCDLQ
ncbi:MAG: hypothetical protein K0T99_01365 [Alphaproteobacteria bacterium]|nr:hypothetical protein [Alphaproteobacteria bacterium]